MHYQHLIFDLYGTLADIHTDESKKELWKLLAVWYGSHGAAYTPWNLKKEYRLLVQETIRQTVLRHPQYTAVDIRLETVFERLYSRRGIQASKELAMETALFFRTMSRTYLRLYPGVRETLRQLKAQGRHICLLTNAQAAFTLPELQLLGIADLFDAIVISSTEECKKPDPHFFQILSERYQVEKSSALMIGNDPYTDIAGANAYGIDSVYLHSGLSPTWTGRPDSTFIIPDGRLEKLKKLLSR